MSEVAERTSILAVPEGLEWTTARHESPTQVVFDTPGDLYVGVYVGKEVVEFEDKKGEQQTFTVIHWKDDDGPKATNASWALLDAYKDIPVGAITRNLYVKDLDVGQQSALKDFAVDYIVVPRETDTAK